jgi:hypothetical protein
MKLKANELRLGNLVYYKNQIVEVPRIDCNTDNVYDAISLTEEWLNIFVLDKKWYMWGDNKFFFRDNDPSDFYIVDCKYVHQLQNLYFALTGQELKK